MFHVRLSESWIALRDRVLVDWWKLIYNERKRKIRNYGKTNQGNVEERGYTSLRGWEASEVQEREN